MNTIVDPSNNKEYSVFSETGTHLLKTYIQLFQQNGGSVKSKSKRSAHSNIVLAKKFVRILLKSTHFKKVKFKNKHGIQTTFEKLAPIIIQFLCGNDKDHNVQTGGVPPSGLPPSGLPPPPGRSDSPDDDYELKERMKEQIDTMIREVQTLNNSDNVQDVQTAVILRYEIALFAHRRIDELTQELNEMYNDDINTFISSLVAFTVALEKSESARREQEMYVEEETARINRLAEIEGIDPFEAMHIRLHQNNVITNRNMITNGIVGGIATYILYSLAHLAMGLL